MKLIRVFSMLQEVGILPTLVYFYFWAGNGWMFEFMSGVLFLGEDMELPQEEGVFTKAKKCSPRQRGSPRRRYVRLSEPGDRIVEVSGPPR